ncbi:unnamed protein product [Urochloa humidicola]
MSYASGGAGILNSTNAGNNISLLKQVDYFSATKSKMAAAVGSGTVSAKLAESLVLDHGHRRERPFHVRQCQAATEQVSCRLAERHHRILWQPHLQLLGPRCPLQ